MILHALLDLLAQDRTWTMAELAARLNVNQPMLEQMLEMLARQGYIATAVCLTQACSGCSNHSQCGPADPAKRPKFWKI